MDQKEEKLETQSRPLDPDAWMDPEDWEQVKLDQLKLMLSDDGDPDFDLDKTLGFDESLIREDWEPEIPGFADRRSRTVEEILRQQEEDVPQVELPRVKTIDPMPEVAPDAATDEPENAEKSQEKPGRSHWHLGRKKEKPVETPAPREEKKAPTLVQETVSLEEAMARISIPMDEDPPDMTLEEALEGFAPEKPNRKKQRWEAEMPKIDLPEETPDRAPAEDKKENQADKAREKAEKQAARQAKKAEKQAARAAALENGQERLAGLIVLVCLESAALIGLLGWWYHWMH